MSEQQSSFGSGLARMFGYVKDEDRTKWEQQRAANAKNVGAVRAGMATGVGSFMDFAERNINSQLTAQAKVSAQEQFDESHNRIINKHRDANNQVVESVEWVDKDGLEDLGSDFGY